MKEIQENLIKVFLKRVLFFSIPLLGLYFYSEMAFKANRQKEHPTDVGLGIAIYLFFILLFLFLGFTIDTISKFIKKDYKIVWINMIFLLPFILLILYLGTLFFGGPMYEMVKDLNNQDFIYLGLIYLVLIPFGFLMVYKYSLKKTLLYLTIVSSIASGHFFIKYNIKEYYGENKDIYFKGNVTDTIIAIGSDKMSVLAEGQIERKTWNRVYIKTNNQTLELKEWIKPIATKYSDSIKCVLIKPSY